MELTLEERVEKLIAGTPSSQPERIREARSILRDLDAREGDALHVLAEAGLPMRGAALEPRERNLTGEAALLVSGIPLRESEVVAFDDLPMLERLAVLTGIGDERAAAMSESSGVPLRGGDIFLRNEVDLRAAFGEPDEDVSADELLRRGGLPMREAKPAHEVIGELAKAVPADHEDRPAVDDLVRKGAALSDDDRANVRDLSATHLDAPPPEDDDDADADAYIPRTMEESEARSLLAAGGIPTRLGT